MSKQAKAMAVLVLENAALKDERDRLRTSVQSWMAEANERSEQWENDRAELKAAGINYDRAIRDRDRLQEALNDARAERNHMKGQLEAMERDRDALAAELRAGREQERRDLMDAKALSFLRGRRARDAGCDAMPSDLAPELQNAWKRGHDGSWGGTVSTHASLVGYEELLRREGLRDGEE